jgi:deoxyadenosine/deoxycytidine kinase
MHIAIVGNIGAGKTTLTELLAKNYGWEPLLKLLIITPTWKIFTAT